MAKSYCLFSVVGILFCILAVGKTERHAPRTPACSMQKKIGPCKGAMPRYHFNENTRRCKVFTWGGCEPNRNNFVSKSDCTKRCRCHLRKKTGPCKASITRYYYDSSTNSCLTFVYGGCKANMNNFKTARHCRRACVKKRNRMKPSHGRY